MYTVSAGKLDLETHLFVPSNLLERTERTGTHDYVFFGKQNGGAMLQTRRAGGTAHKYEATASASPGKATERSFLKPQQRWRDRPNFRKIEPTNLVSQNAEIHPFSTR